MTDGELAAEAGAEPAALESGMTRRELALSRSLFAARTRAEDRLQRFLDAALELMKEGVPGKEFTVHEVVERSGQSLRLFYQYFGSKHELLLALFEESVRSTAEFLGDRMAGEDDPLGRIHRFVVEYYRLCRPPLPGEKEERPSTAPAMTDFAQQLLTSHPAEAALAFAPLVSLLGEVLDQAESVGCIRAGLRHRMIAGMTLEAIMFNAFSTTIGGTPVRESDSDPAEDLWEFILHGVGTGDRG